MPKRVCQVTTLILCTSFTEIYKMSRSPIKGSRVLSSNPHPLPAFPLPYGAYTSNCITLTNIFSDPGATQLRISRQFYCLTKHSFSHTLRRLNTREKRVCRDGSGGFSHNNRYLSRVTPPSVAMTVVNGGPDIQIELEFRSVGFCEGRKHENPEKNPRDKARTNRKINPHETASAGIETG